MDDSELIRAQIKEKKRELSRKVRERDELERHNRLMISLIDDIDRMEEMSIGELATFRSKLKKAREIIAADRGAAYGELRKIDAALELTSSFIELHSTMMKTMHRMVRDARIEQRRQLDAHHKPDERLCVNCHKRPRHFDDLCKRCANELGNRPTGKVV